MLELLGGQNDINDIHIIVLFRVCNGSKTTEFVERINSGRKMYVGATKWEGEDAIRIAVATWKVNVSEDSAFIQKALEEALSQISSP